MTVDSDRDEYIYGFLNIMDAWASYGCDGRGGGVSAEETRLWTQRQLAGEEQCYFVPKGTRVKIVMDEVPARPSLCLVEVLEGQKITKLGRGWDEESKPIYGGKTLFLPRCDLS